MIRIKRDFDKIIKKHKAFMNRDDVDKPLFCIYVQGKENAAKLKRTYKNIPEDREVKPDDIVLDDYIKDVEESISWHEEAGFDYFFPIVPYWFINWMEAIIGCPIYPGKNSFYAKSFIKNWNDFSWEIDLSNSNKWLCKLLDMTKVLVEHFGDKYPIGSSTLLRGPADLVSAALGYGRFPLELYDNPDKLKKFISICTDAFIKVARMVNEIASKAKYKGFVVNIFGIWTEEVCQYYQDDAVAFMSPKFYKEFLLKSHLKISGSFPSSFYHIHPVSLFVSDEIIKFPNIKIIEINREPEVVGPSLSEMIPTFKKIQDNNKALLINFTDIDFNENLIEEETRIAYKNLSSKGLCIFICADDVGDALRKAKAVNKVFKIF